MTHVPRSEQFDDVYFSVQDGLAEAQHVFLAGNSLPEAWAGCETFTICETGFGTGLSFLAVLQLLESCPSAPHVHFISFEKYPLDRGYIRKCLSHWDELESVLGELLAKYPSDLKEGTHVMDISERVTLTLIIGDMNDEIPKLESDIDCWFLDGFKPSSNPDMWSEILFSNMARLSREGARFATFTSAGFVRRGLAAAGFEWRKVRGYRYKREMCVGTYMGEASCAST